MPSQRKVLPERVVERLVAYRRHLHQWLGEGQTRIYSHDLARLEKATPAQVRRDLMTIGYTGSPAKGYEVKGLVDHIAELLDTRSIGGFALVGAGHLGRAILDYLARRQPDYHVAAFDVNPEKGGRITHGCRCYMIDELEQVLAEYPMRVGVIAVPAEAAQEVATRLIAAGVQGLLNFAPVRLRVPDSVFVEDADIALLLEKVAFFAGTGRSEAQM